MSDGIMEDYYRQKRIRKAIIDFVYSGSSDPLRECAFFNEDIRDIQRHESGGDSVFVLDSEETIADLLKRGSSAFYASYWRYSDPYQASGVRGRDLVWSIKAEEGGLSAAKELTSLFLEALEDEGFPQPLLKYSGKLGFDILIPVEHIQAGSSADLEFFSRIHRDLTTSATDYIEEESSFDPQDEGSKIKFKGRLGTCLLTELRWRRGLILAPMSLHPSSGLASVPLLPREVSEFSVVDATPENVRVREWSTPRTLPGNESDTSVQYTLGNFSPGIKA